MGTQLLVRRRDGLELTRAGHELFACLIGSARWSN